MKLFSNTTSGAIKFVDIYTDGPKLISEWGILNGKVQRTEKVCKAMNTGKANATTPAEQAITEMFAKITKKKEEGYSEKMPKVGASVVETEIDLDHLPESFCPSKPVSDTPEKIINNITTYGQRKHNGNCIIISKGETEKVYSRRMKEITATMKQIPEITKVFEMIPKGTMVNCEMIFVNNKGVESTASLGSLVRTKDPDEVMEKYNTAVKEGKFYVKVFDIIFYNNEFFGENDYIQRHKLISDMGLDVPEIIPSWKDMIETAKEEGWEGFILRVPGEKSHITYTTNGKADRAGCYKYKFLKSDDFIVTEVERGKAGRHAEVYARFKLSQFDTNRREVDCGWAGPGTLSQEQLEQYTKEIDNKKLKLPFVVEVEFRERQEESAKLEHPVIQRIRFDKPRDECIYTD